VYLGLVSGMHVTAGLLPGLASARGVAILSVSQQPARHGRPPAPAASTCDDSKAGMRHPQPRFFVSGCWRSAYAHCGQQTIERRVRTPNPPIAESKSTPAAGNGTGVAMTTSEPSE